MIDLTYKWKKGELPDGMYYIENTSGIIGMVGHSKAFPCYNVKQILAPVPSYEEWQAKKVENQHLKELLKECLVYIPYSYPQFQTEKRIDLDSAKLNLLSRINAAIGESEE